MSRQWMPLYVADYLADTGHLTTIEHGAYVLLIMHYWANRGLPADDARLARIARMSEREWAKVRSVVAEFFDDDWKHGRIEDELARADEISNKRKAAAQQKHSKSSAIADQMHTQSPSPSPSPSQSQIDDDGEPPNAFELSAKLAAICGYPTPDDWPPGWCGVPHWVQKCLNEGWLPAVMIAETRAVVKRKRDGPPDSFRYLEKPLARAHALHQAPLPKVETPKQEVISGSSSQAGFSRRGGNILDAIDRLPDGRGEAVHENPVFRLPDR